MPGVLRTEVGYAGGIKDAPTYHDLGAHAEVLQVEFDPSNVSYDTLLQEFWNGHEPTRSGRSSQYRSILLCESEEELTRAQKSAAMVEERLGRKVQTEILVGMPFTPAEDYHQKWKLRQRRQLFAELAQCFSNEEELLRSFAATKLNALVGGHLSSAQLEEIRGQLTLSAELLELARHR